MKMTSEEFEKELLNGRCLIPLGKGYFAEVDSEDYDYLTQFEWYYHKEDNYAIRNNKVNSKWKSVNMHKIISERMGYNLFVDHKNGDGLDNRRENLREVTQQQNVFNSRLSIKNKTGYKGVYFNKTFNKFHAQIKFNGKKIHLGYYNDPKEAYIKYCKAAFYYFGEFANYG